MWKCGGLACLLATVALSAHAQSPTYDQIINSLKSQHDLAAGQHRGIRTSGLGDAPRPADQSRSFEPAVVAQPVAPPPATVPQSRVPSVRPQPAPERVAAAAPADVAAAPSVSLTVQFPSGSADLTDDAKQSLGDLGRALASDSLAGYRFRIEGHTDTVGNPGDNKALSARRAEAVKRFIVSTYHVDGGRLEARGRGEEDLAVPTPLQTPEPRNRRVRVLNVSS